MPALIVGGDAKSVLQKRVDHFAVLKGVFGKAVHDEHRAARFTVGLKEAYKEGPILMA